MDKLNEKDLMFFGGIFPGIIYGEQKDEQGAVMTKLPLQGIPILVQNLSSGNYSIPIPDFGDTNPPAGHSSALVLLDGLTEGISGFLSRLYDQLASSVSYFGGGAGSLSLIQKPCIFTPQGAFQDAAVIALLDHNCKLGVRHGWERFKGPLIATRTEKNIIHELN